MAHMDRMIIVNLWGMRERRILKRVREKISNKAPQEPIDAISYMRLNGVTKYFRSFFTLARDDAAGEWIFEHREAVSTPLSDGTIAHSLIRHAHLAPCHDIRYSRCLLLNRLVRVQSENTSGGLHVWERSIGRCLSIPKHTRYYPMVGDALIHQVVSLGRHRN